MIPNSAKFPTKRRRYYSPPVQLKYAVLLSVISGFVSLAMIFVMAWFMQRNYTLFLGDELGVSTQVIEIVRQEQKMLEIALFILFLFSISISFTASFIITRKLTGPINALERHLMLFSNGDWSRQFRLRKNDEFKGLESIVNQMRLNHLEQQTHKKKSTA